MSHFRMRRCAVVFSFAVVCSALFTSLNVWAEEVKKPEFPISDEQVRVLGVELVTLASQLDVSTLAFPAQIVLPPQSEQVVSAPVAGVIKQMLVQENQSVTVGEPLLVLNSPEFGELQLAAIHASSQARLTSQAMLREKALFDEGIIPRRRVDEARAAQRDADAQLRQALAALELLGLSKENSVAIADAGHVKSELTLAAQSSGSVTALTVKPGQRVSVADPLLHVTTVDTLWIDVQIPSGYVDRWPAGSTLAIAGGIKGKVLSVSPIASSAQTVLLRAQLENAPQNIHPGEYVQAELPMAAGETWDAPLSAIARDGAQAYVFVRESGHFVATPVDIVASAGQRVKISGVLKAGTRIASTSVVALKAAWMGLGGAEEE